MEFPWRACQTEQEVKIGSRKALQTATSPFAPDAHRFYGAMGFSQTSKKFQMSL
jgi:hypothetical protein